MRQILSVIIAANTIRRTSMVKTGYSVPNAMYGATKNVPGHREKEILFTPLVFNE
jgi:hypothetical protein